MNHTLEAAEDEWDNRQLGADKAAVKKLTAEDEAKVDELLDLQVVCIRLPRELEAKLRELAQQNGLGYPSLIRQILARYAQGQ